MKVAYIAGPYRSATGNGVDENIRRAREIALKYWRKGYAVICPHLNTAHFCGAAPDTVWLEGDLEIVGRCDVLVAMSTWEQSSWTKAEIALAQDIGMEIIYDDGRLD